MSATTYATNSSRPIRHSLCGQGAPTDRSFRARRLNSRRRAAPRSAAPFTPTQSPDARCRASDDHTRPPRRSPPGCPNGGRRARLRRTGRAGPTGPGHRPVGPQLAHRAPPVPRLSEARGSAAGASPRSAASGSARSSPLTSVEPPQPVAQRVGVDEQCGGGGADVAEARRATPRASRSGPVGVLVVRQEARDGTNRPLAARGGEVAQLEQQRLRLDVVEPSDPRVPRAPRAAPAAPGRRSRATRPPR